MTKDVLRVVLFLGLVGFCCGSSGVWASIIDRFCKAEYAFKFRVVSSEKGECAPDLTKSVSTPSPDSGTSNDTTVTTHETASVSPEISSQATTKTIPTQSTERAAAETITGMGKNSRWGIVTTDPTTQLASTFPDRESYPVTGHPGVTESTNATANPTQLRRMKRCILIYHQKVRVLKKRIFKGGDKLKMLKGVTEKVTYYIINMKRGYFMRELEKGKNYYFAGRSIDDVLVATFSTVERWKGVVHLKKKFKTKDTCQSS